MGNQAQCGNILPQNCVWSVFKIAQAVNNCGNFRQHLKYISIIISFICFLAKSLKWFWSTEFWLRNDIWGIFGLLHRIWQIVSSVVFRAWKYLHFRSEAGGLILVSPKFSIAFPDSPSSSALWKPNTITPVSIWKAGEQARGEDVRGEI